AVHRSGGKRRNPHQGRTEESGRLHSVEAWGFPLSDRLQNGDFRLDGRVAVITGAGSGIGLAIARRFAAQGARVHVLDLNESSAEAACQRITVAGGIASAHLCDVTILNEVKTVFAEIFRRERVHILVNNAGISHIGTVESTSEEDFDRLLRTN